MRTAILAISSLGCLQLKRDTIVILVMMRAPDWCITRRQLLPEYWAKHYHDRWWAEALWSHVWQASCNEAQFNLFWRAAHTPLLKQVLLPLFTKRAMYMYTIKYTLHRKKEKNKSGLHHTSSFIKLSVEIFLLVLSILHRFLSPVAG